jgi:hypothetical protein
MDEENSTPDQLLRQMLAIVFGWDGEIEDLIRDESEFLSPISSKGVLPPFGALGF